MKKNLVAITVLAASGLVQADVQDLFFDPADGMLDVSKWLDSAWGFMPVIMPITEPAVGYGLAGAGVFFHQRLTQASDGSVYLPSVSGLAGMATNNGSRGVGAFHSQAWDDNNWRYMGLIGSGDINLKLRLSDTDLALRYKLKGLYTSHEVTRKLWRSLRASVAYQYAKFDVSFTDLNSGREEQNANLTIGLDWDQLDNPMSPMSGHKIGLYYYDYNSRWGGDYDYGKVRLDARFYHKWEQWRLALRGQYESAQDKAPFYAKPFVNVRGVPAMAYMGNSAASAELEAGYQFDSRWSAIGFGGYGKTENSLFPELGIYSQQSITAAGVGFRYLIAKTYGLQAGLDVAHNSEGENTLYFQVGSGWR